MAFHALTVTYIISLLGLWAVSLIGRISPAFVMFAGLLIVLSVVYNHKTRKAIPTGAWNIAAVAILLLFLADFVLISGELIVSGSRFLTVLLALKLFDLRTGKDHFIVFGLAFFQILACAASTVSPVFFAILTLYIIFSIWALIVFNLKRDLQGSGLTIEVPRDVFGVRFFLSVICLSLLSILLTAALFFSIPRMGVGIFERKTNDTLSVSGFSDRMDLGSIGSVKLDSTVVMRVEMPDGKRPESPLYLRGAALDLYHGSGWSRHTAKRRLLKKEDGGFNIGAPDRKTPDRKKTIEQRIWLEPLDTDVLFAASSAFRLSGDFANLWIDPDNAAMRLPAPPFSRLQYSAWSDVSGVIPSPAPDALYLDTSYLDKAAEGRTIRRLSLAITQGRKGPLEKALAIQNYLRSNFDYNLSVEGQGSATPLEDFLLRTKEGYCEHFSTAMAMLLRSSGVPARVVTGYQQGEWNELGGYFIVRQQDAHSWVEAYIDGRGWMRFDPTPAAPSAYRPSVLTLYLDFMRLRWNRYVIQYSFKDQQRIAKEARMKASGLLDMLKEPFRTKGYSGAESGLATLLALVLLAAAGSVLALRRAYGRKGRSKTPAYYLDMLKILEASGIRKLASETPTEFARRTGEPCVDEVTRVYEEERFGGRTPLGDELAGVMKALECIKCIRGIRKRPS